MTAVIALLLAATPVTHWNAPPPRLETKFRAPCKKGWHENRYFKCVRP